MSTSKGLFIDPLSGNVGIGTKTPQFSLDVIDQTYITNNSLYILGNLGIGTTIPKQQLDVNGDILASNLAGIFITPITRTTSNAQRFAYNCNIAGIPFDGSQNIAFPSIIAGSYITGTSYNGSNISTFTINATSNNTPNYIVGRDATGSFSTRTIYGLSNLGIGTTIVNKTLEIYGNINFDTGSGLYINNQAGPSNSLLTSNQNGISWAAQPGKSHTVLTVGSGTFTIPTGIQNLYIQMWGGGGGGGQGIISSAACSGGGGGASGSYISFMLNNITTNNISSFTYSVGAGGVGGAFAGLGGQGADGSNTSITINNITVTVNGGGGGPRGKVGVNSGGGATPTALTNTFTYLQYGDGVAGASGVSGAAGGAGSVATTSWAPGSGGAGGGISGTTTLSGGNGGGSLQLGGGNIGNGTGGAGNATAGSTGTAGSGYLSATITIPGAGGGGGGNGAGASGIGGAGGAGGTPGGGGGGAGSGQAGTNNGGTGGDGLIFVTCF